MGVFNHKLIEIFVFVSIHRKSTPFLPHQLLGMVVIFLADGFH